MKNSFYSYTSSNGVYWEPCGSAVSLLGAKILCTDTLNLSMAAECCVTKYKARTEHCICKKIKNGEWKAVRKMEMKIIEGEFQLKEQVS